jgi:uncharacterized protein (DUF302 family)
LLVATYGTTVHPDLPFDEAVQAARAALAEQGFGVLTEIDVRATMKAKLDVDVPSQVILGACNPPLAHRALAIEPSIGLLLPCNVVVRETEDGTVVEAIDPAVLVAFTGNEALEPIAAAAGQSLAAAMTTLNPRTSHV